MPAERLRQHLQDHGVEFELRSHPREPEAQHLAAAEHVTGWDVAKAVILARGDEFVMVVLPAPMEVDLEAASAELGNGQLVRLAEESEFTELFPDCEAGAQPPFGDLYGLPVYLEATMQERERLVARAGTHTETVELSVDDYLRVVRPTVVRVGVAQI